MSSDKLKGSDHTKVVIDERVIPSQETIKDLIESGFRKITSNYNRKITSIYNKSAHKGNPAHLSGSVVSSLSEGDQIKWLNVVKGKKLKLVNNDGSAFDNKIIVPIGSYKNGTTARASEGYIKMDCIELRDDERAEDATRIAEESPSRVVSYYVRNGFDSTDMNGDSHKWEYHTDWLDELEDFLAE